MFAGYLLASRDPAYLWLANLGLLLHDEGKYEEAEKLLRECLEKSRRVLGEDEVEALWNLGLGWRPGS